MEQDKPSGVAASQAAAADIGYAMQTVENLGFYPRTLPKGYKMTITPQPWIPVSERLPERNEIVLAVDQGGVTVGSYSPMLEDWWALHADRMAPGAVVTHWMPLPSPPTE